ncbi:MAG: sugar or sugar nucleotide oxidoreductase [Candidatus Saccharibacteria bacterium]|nr:sugar or sugar nucleotide oxidoreductase [Candidatus Saccharibacteria bacterium]
MKLAVSNIAWTKEEEPQIAGLLQSLGVKYIEIAPTKTWDEPTEATDSEIEQYKAWWGNYGIEIVAFQSMLFSHPDYTLFESDSERQKTQDYLESFTELAGKVGAKRMVFGSPRNRQRNDMPNDEAINIAEDFFTGIANVAAVNDVVFCVEPNAPQYNCDFITNAAQGIELVKRVNSPGFGLHLDIACMTLAEDDITASINDGKEYLKHFHISTPMLGPVSEGDGVQHSVAAAALKDVGYDGYVSIEMRPGDEGTNLDRVKTAVQFAQKTYFS